MIPQNKEYLLCDKYKSIANPFKSQQGSCSDCLTLQETS